MEDAERRGRARQTPHAPQAPQAPLRGARALLALGVVGLLLAGCASMPDRGEIRRVEASQGVDSQVRVFGVPRPTRPARPRSSTASWRP